MSKPAKLSKVQIQIMNQLNELKDKYHNGYEYIDRHILVHEGEVWFRCFGGRQDTLNALVRKGVLKEHTITITEGYQVATYYAEIAAPVLVKADEPAAEIAENQATCESTWTAGEFKHTTEQAFNDSIKAADDRRAAMEQDPTFRQATPEDFTLGAILHDNHGAWTVAEKGHDDESWDLKGPGGWRASSIHSARYYFVKVDEPKEAVHEISFRRLEGHADEVGESYFETFSELDKHIRSAAQTAPNNGASDKCSYIVIWKDNETYSGRFDLQFKHTQGSGFLQEQIKFELTHPKNPNRDESLAWMAARSFADQAVKDDQRLDGSEQADHAAPAQAPTAEADEEIHIWEAAGIGVAPFTFKGYFTTPSRALQAANPSAYDNAMAMLPQGYPKGGCSICGTGITNHFMVQDANGEKLVAGSSCIKKSGDKGLTTKAKLAKKRHDQQVRFEEAEARRLAALEQERQVNGGLTNYELEQKQRADAEEARLAALEPIIKELEPYADRVADGRGAFRDSVAESLDKGELPKGRGLTIMIEILAREQGRRGSKAYQAEEARLTTFFDEIQDRITSITS